MDRLEKKEAVKAILIADNFDEHFVPLTNAMNQSLIPLVNTPMIDYSLEALNRAQVEEVYIFCCNFIDQVKSHIKNRIASKCTWSIGMSVQVVASEGCRSLGEALRDFDAKGLIRGHFILMNADTITNAMLLPILEHHLKTCKFDKGTAMTVVYKKCPPGFRNGDEIMIAQDAVSHKLLHHQRLKSNSKERHFDFPLEMFTFNSEVVLHHDFIDPQIAICSPTMLPLFADNFDFETRDDFIRGLLINEEILASSIYVTELPSEQFACRVSNWQTYQIISNEIINRGVYPLVPDMGICCLFQKYAFLRNNIYRNKNVQLARDSILQENVVIQENCSIDDKSLLSFTVVGKNCKIGKNCRIENAFLFEDVEIGDNVTLSHCVIGFKAKINTNAKITDGSVVGNGVVIASNAKIIGHYVVAAPDGESKKLGEKCYILQREEDNDNVEDDDDEPEIISNIKMSHLKPPDVLSNYSSSSEEEESRASSPVQEDSNIFLSEVIDSLTRGVEEKSNPDFLILEINSSRYAYNMTLTEVNFYVVKAILSLPSIIKFNNDVLTGLNQTFNLLGPVMKNYIRGADAMLDCLKAIEECCNQNEDLKRNVMKIIHYFYNKEILVEDVILKWYKTLDGESSWMKDALEKFINWLEEASEEESNDDDE